MKTQELEQLNEELKELEEEYKKLENNENEEEYDNWLDESGNVEVCGIKFSPSRILKELDQIAYDCGLNDYNDSRLSELEQEIEDKKEEIKELQD